jgi:transposase
LEEPFMRSQGGAGELERRRFRAVKLVEEGVPRKWIVRVLGVSRGTLSRWCKLAASCELQAKPHPGCPRRLTDEDCQRLKELLSEGAAAHGWDNNLWTCARVGEVIKKHFEVEYHPAHVSRLLRDRLDWTCQRPTFQHIDRDDAAIRTWVRSTFPRVVRAAGRRGAYLVFIDEAGFLLEPVVRRTYAPRGHTPVQRVADKHGRISAIGAILVSPRRDCIKLQYGLLANNVNFRGPTVVQFLRTLRADLAAPMAVFWDQIPIHDCSALDEYLAAASDVALEPFPPYAPELNPADGLWRHIKYGRLANYCPPDLLALRSKITTELDRLQGQPELLKSFVRFTKLPLDL